jgi:signal transduction histidine kinase
MGGVDGDLRQRLTDVALRLRPGLLAAARGLAVGLLSVSTNVVLFVLSVVSLALIPALGIGFVVFPLVTLAVRWRANLHRRFAGWSGVAIPAAYRPLPADGGAIGTWHRFRATVSDPATWLDFAWLIPGALSGAAFGLAAGGLTLYGLEGLLLVPVSFFVPLDWFGYGPFWPLDHPLKIALVLPLAVLFLAIGVTAAPWLMWLDARFASFFLAPTESARLRQRVEQLTATRAEAVDAQAAELRRIERDLHDGAQARLVSLSMSIGLAEEMLHRDPAAAERLLAEARESSGLALAELRSLVRGIHPPVLAERGLDGAVRALALAVPLRVHLDIALPGRPVAPVESTAYFAVAEALANVAKHSGARSVSITIAYRDGRLLLAVRDDGTGGADPAAGSGLRGMRRRLAAFDGTMVVSSPPGGPTVVTMELPCELSSPKTSPSSGTG